MPYAEVSNSPTAITIYNQFKNIVFYCIIHQEAKFMQQNLSLKKYHEFSCINHKLYTKNGLVHRQQFLKEIEAEYCGVVYLTEVCWINRSLKCCFNLKEEINIFMNEKGKEKLIPNMFSNIKSFLVKFKLFYKHIDKKIRSFRLL